MRDRNRELTESLRNLRQLIYWMEHDRSLNAQRDKIFFLKEHVVNIESRIDKRQRVAARSDVGRYPQIRN